MKLNQLIKRIELNPKKLFLIDGLGALLSVFLLGYVLVQYENTFGIPAKTLYILASIPLLFMVFDFYAYQQSHHKTGRLLLGIATLNSIYCFVSLGLVICHSNLVTNLGWIYVIVEIVIVLVLARIEFSLGRKIMSGMRTSNGKENHIL